MPTSPMTHRPDLDMSPEAVDRRLRTVSDLRDLGLSLQKARRLPNAADLPESASQAVRGLTPNGSPEV